MIPLPQVLNIWFFLSKHFIVRVRIWSSGYQLLNFTNALVQDLCREVEGGIQRGQHTATLTVPVSPVVMALSQQVI